MCPEWERKPRDLFLELETDMEALTWEHAVLRKLSPRFITNAKGEKEEIVFDFLKFQELWEEIEDMLVDEDYESREDAKIAPVVLERGKRFDQGQRRGYTQEEVEKMCGACG